MKISFLKTVLFLTILLGLSCSNNDDPQEQLPPITQTGANTFGCYIDRKLLTPRDGNGNIYSPNKGMKYSTGPDNTSHNEIYINVRYKARKIETIHIKKHLY